MPCDYHSDFDNAAEGLRCLCETPGSVASTTDAVAWLDAWTEADLERRRGYLVPAILTCAVLALLPWLISCSVTCIRSRCCAARATTTSDTEPAAAESRLRDATLTAARLHARIKRVLLGLGWTVLCLFALQSIMWPVSRNRGVLEPILIPQTLSLIHI